eukprot:TRINITY_DN41165_c0_g1_i1.p1 TRINITY_DN41165_c0_g1~~TRINITY_DN41165_c0_g1_i1.p1  ORF type:complete len:334 (-),score=118.27 TRINITY_DN41165_c0_g1_i1:84-1085(-)
MIDTQAPMADGKDDPFSRPTIVPQATKWVEDLERIKAERAQEEESRRRQAAEQADLVRQWQLALHQAEADRDDALRRSEESELRAKREVQDHHWQTVQATTELEDRVATLEAMLLEERQAHEDELRRQSDILEQARQECFSQLQEAEARHQAALGAALARTKEAEETAELVQKRANDEIAAARARQDVRVAEVRAQADARVRQLEVKMREEANMRDQHLIERQRAMEENLYTNTREKQEAVDEARRHLAAMEQELADAKAKQEAAYTEQVARLEEFKATTKRNTDEEVKHQKGLLELEQTLHARTMERTMDRVTRHLKLGEEAQEQGPAAVTA